MFWQLGMRNDRGAIGWIRPRSLGAILLALTMALVLGGCYPTPEAVEPRAEETVVPVEKMIPEVQMKKTEELERHPEDESEESKLDEAVRQQVQAMSLEEKAGQVLFLAMRYNQAGQPMRRMNEDDMHVLEELRPGGIILFSENIQHNAQVQDLIIQFQSTADIPLLMAVDQEGGRVSRLTGGDMSFPSIPSARELGQHGDADGVFEVGKSLGRALSMLGFNMNMAPVADVDSNPRNPVIGDRSYGSDPEMVATLVLAFARGLEMEGVIPVLKHFPGHGDTDMDSHFQAVTLSHPLERLEEVEFFPFRKGVEMNVPVIMTGHIQLHALDPDLPATLSSALVTTLLRGEWGFQGVVISDALEMGAISQRWSSGEAAVKALQAGVDLLLMPENYQEAHAAIVQAVDAGILTREVLDGAVTRVLRLKHLYGLLD